MNVNSMKRNAGHLSLRLLFWLAVAACLILGVIGLVLPIIPGLLFLAIAVFLPGENRLQARQRIEHVRVRPRIVGVGIDGADAVRARIVEADVAQLSLEKPLFVKPVGRKSAAAEGLSGRVEADRVVGRDHARAKNDRGDVSFAGRPQAHQHPNGSVRDA